MNNNHISEAFSMLIEEFERAIHEINREGAKAFEEKRYEDIPVLTGKAKDIESFQTKVVALEDEWASRMVDPSHEKDIQGKCTKPAPTAPVAFHAACVAKAEIHLKTDFVKQTRSAFVSNDGQIALVVSVSKEHNNGSRKFCWFSFYPYQAEFLQSKPNGYLALGCGSPDKVLLIPYREFEPLTKKLNKSVREDESFYWHIRIVTDGVGFRLKLEGRGNEINVAKYQITTE